MAMDYSAAFKRELQQRMALVARNLQQERPEYSQLKFKAEIRAYREPPTGWGKHPMRIINGFLTNAEFRRMANQQVVARVADWYPGYKPSLSIMTRTLQPSLRKAIQASINSHGLAIQVRPDDTLSTLKKAIRARGRAEEPTNRGTIAVELGQEYVTINGNPYRIEPSRADPSIRVVVFGGKRQYLRCDILQALMG